MKTGRSLLSTPPHVARYEGEGALIDENFKLRKGLRKETINHDHRLSRWFDQAL